MTFSELNVSDNLCKALEQQGISEPTYIQSHTYKPGVIWWPVLQPVQARHWHICCL